MTEITYTNSSTSCFRRCPREYDLRYRRRLSPHGEDREVLQVGRAWHKAHDAFEKAVDPAHAQPAAYEAIQRHAPGDAWKEKLSRLFAGYLWRWSREPLEIVQAERVFRVELDGFIGEGQIDAVARIDGRLGLVERKTSGEDLAPGAPYWDRLRMDSQLSFYAAAFRELVGEPPAFILYDVVRKPTIRPKNLVKKDMQRLRMELRSKGVGTYYGQQFSADVVEAALHGGTETTALYGARLTADIGDRPDFYYQRRFVPRTELDMRAARADVAHTVGMIRHLESGAPFFPRNPESCARFGLCDFFGLCSNNDYPDHDTVPGGFARREHLHPELHTDGN